MKLDVYTPCWNEEYLIPYYLRHYERFARKIVVYDNGSTDDSRRLLEAHPLVTLREHETDGMDEYWLRWVKERAWAENDSGDADWVLGVDVDELLYHPDLVGFLRGCRSRGETLLRPRGHLMLAEEFPTGDGLLTDLVRRGVRQPDYDKPCLFDPSGVHDLRLEVGGHRGAPTGPRVVVGEHPELKLLHYQALGDKLLDRYRRYRGRVAGEAGSLGWKTYFEDREELDRIFREAQAQAGDVV